MRGDAVVGEVGGAGLIEIELYDDKRLSPGASLRDKRIDPFNEGDPSPVE